MTDHRMFLPPEERQNIDNKPAPAAEKAADRKKRKEQNRILRIAIQVIFFLLAPSLFTTAFSGIKHFFTLIHQGEPLENNGFITVLVALCIFTMLFGRYFCGYVCAFGSLGDFVYYLSEKVQKKTGRRLPPLPEKAEKVMQHLPYLILILIMLLCGLGVYDHVTGWSPWEVFALITAGNFHLGGSILGIILLLLIISGMAAESRFFCRFLCPMGAVFRLLPVFPWSLLKRDTDKCINGCSACRKLCPVHHELSAGLNAGDCIRCGKCTDICPRGNISIGPVPKNPWVSDYILRGNELWLTVVKAVILFILAAAAGAVRFL